MADRREHTLEFATLFLLLGVLFALLIGEHEPRDASLWGCGCGADSEASKLCMEACVDEYGAIGGWPLKAPYGVDYVPGYLRCRCVPGPKPEGAGREAGEEFTVTVRRLLDGGIEVE